MILFDVGHSRIAPGAYNDRISEWQYNNEVARIIEEKHIENVSIIYRKNGLRGLIEEINGMCPRIVVSLHCNSSINSKATGTEVLYWYTSAVGRKAAEKVQPLLLDLFKLKDRGIKPITSSDRGGYQLKNVKSVNLILEPFFLSNGRDVEVALRKQRRYADALAELTKIL